MESFMRLAPRRLEAEKELRHFVAAPRRGSRNDLLAWCPVSAFARNGAALKAKIDRDMCSNVEGTMFISSCEIRSVRQIAVSSFQLSTTVRMRRWAPRAEGEAAMPGGGACRKRMVAGPSLIEP